VAIVSRSRANLDVALAKVEASRVTDFPSAPTGSVIDTGRHEEKKHRIDPSHVFTARAFNLSSAEEAATASSFDGAFSEPPMSTTTTATTTDDNPLLPPHRCSAWGRKEAG
jgi:hypothetical protein